MYNKMNSIMQKNEEKILRELFNKPSYKFHIRELARITKLNPNTIINIAKKLEKQRLVKNEPKKHLTEISLNFENKETTWKKRVFNLSQIYSSGVIEFLVKKYSPVSISLIGSYSRGEDIEKSDIDIVLITGKKEIADLSEFDKILGKRIHLLTAKTSDISDEFFNNLINGIVLYGAVKR